MVNAVIFFEIVFRAILQKQFSRKVFSQNFASFLNLFGFFCLTHFCEKFEISRKSLRNTNENFRIYSHFLAKFFIRLNLNERNLTKNILISNDAQYALRCTRTVLYCQPVIEKQCGILFLFK